MKSRIFMYLFIFTALISLYQYKSASNYVVNTQTSLKKYQERVADYEKLQSDYRKLSLEKSKLNENYESVLDSLSHCNKSEKF